MNNSKILWTHQVNMDMAHYLLECGTCHKKILVEMVLFGAPHNGTPTATCADCILPINEEFNETFPDEAKEIEEWCK